MGLAPQKLQWFRTCVFLFALCCVSLTLLYTYQESLPTVGQQQLSPAVDTSHQTQQHAGLRHPMELLSHRDIGDVPGNIFNGVPVRNATFSIMLYREASGHKFTSRTSADNCPYSNCRILLYPRQVSQADAVITHLRNVSLDMFRSAERRPHQIWIAMLKEAQHRKFRQTFRRFNGLFNATALVERRSDIYYPYGFYALKPGVNRADAATGIGDVSHVNVTRPKLVAWFVGTCFTISRREEYVRRLQEHVQVDIYGKCGTLSCPRRGGNCYEMLERDYKFYLSFENSLCEDYITEKLWNILQFDVVPIVMGGADYKTLLPPHSYIDVRDFNSSEHLAEYLLMLDQNDDLYRQFFAWKQFTALRA